MKVTPSDILPPSEHVTSNIHVKLAVNGSLLIVHAPVLKYEELLKIISLSKNEPCTIYTTVYERECEALIEKHSALSVVTREFDTQEIFNFHTILISNEQSSLKETLQKFSLNNIYYVGEADLGMESDGYSIFINQAAVKWKLRKWKSNWYVDYDGEIKWKRIAAFSVLAFGLMIIGHWIFSYIPIEDIKASTILWVESLDSQFFYMVLAGFLAQMIDGALGMGYGVTSTTILLSSGVNLAAISGSVHSAEMFASGVSGYSHYKFGNVNKKLFRALVIPGVIGAVAGAYLLCIYGDSHSEFVRPLLATYTLFLGVKIILNAFKDKLRKKKFKRYKLLAGAGGFLDSFGGGGWGPIVTSTLISKGRNPKYVIGSVSLTEFFVTLASALTFFVMLGISHWQVILGLVIGSIIAAPFAALLIGKLPRKLTYILLGTLIIFWSGKILWSVF